ncbi:MAG: alpha/beta hydrolase, partial [Ilumatobacter sp.]|nr:alpha/beta hydrolase [Ilumatobacter sp.]
RVRVGKTARMTAVTTHHIAVNGVELVVHEAGDPGNPTVLLCHGFPELAHSWRHQFAPLVDAGFHVLAPDQRGYGHSSAPQEVDAYGIEQLTGDLFALLDHYGKEQAIFVGHDWGSIIVWQAAVLQPERVRAVVGVSVPYVEWPAPPTQLMNMVYGDRFFYILYFQQVGPPEAELDADPRDTMAKVLYGASGAATKGREMPTELPPMEGTGFLTMMDAPPALPYPGPEGPWLTDADLDEYAREFAHSGFFGPVSYYRNLDGNFAVLANLHADRVAMPSYFICGEDDVVRLMDPTGPERMRNLLPDYRGEVLIPDAGHWVQQEAPRAFNDALLGFLRTL